MSVKVNDKEITFKITKEDMKVLHAGRIIKSSVGFSGKDLVVVIRLSQEEKGFWPELTLEQDQATLTLYVSKDTLNSLEGLGKSREGLSLAWNGQQIFLQLDVRSKIKTSYQGQ